MNNHQDIHNRLKKVCSITDEKLFLKELLLSYGLPNALFARLNLETILDFKPLRITNKMLYVLTPCENLYSVLDELKIDDLGKIPVRFVFIINSESVLSVDMLTNDILSVRRKSLYKNYQFLLPLSGIEKSNKISNAEVDIIVAEKFASLYNELLIVNSDTKISQNDINEFILKLLFCFFADSEEVIQRGTLHNLIFTYSKESGDGLTNLFTQIFKRFNGECKSDSEYIKRIPKIKYHLFKSYYPNIQFNANCRDYLLEISQLNWSEISPDILGALVQTLVKEHNSENNNNFTSGPNIQKLIGPLFLNELYEEFENSKNNEQKCFRLLKRISKIKIMDPSCGTGNFLLVSYREIRTLENKLRHNLKTQFNVELDSYKFEISNLYGIENDRLSIEIAKLGLLFTMHQLNKKSDKDYMKLPDLLNEINFSQFYTGNSLKYDWEKICPNNGEVYIIGNPLYKGFQKQSDDQKEDVLRIFSKYKNIKSLDYASCYFYLATLFIESNDNSAFAFVTTNSLTDGQQVSLLWPKLFDRNVHISFAHTAFKWKNSVKNVSAVTVVIIGMRSNNIDKQKTIYSLHHAKNVSWINPYLTPGKLIITKRNNPISNLPKMIKGNMPYNAQYLLLSPYEYAEMIRDYPMSRKYLKRVVGSTEYINGIERWCLWIDESQADNAMTIPPIKKRVEAVRKARLSNADKTVQKLANRPYQFREHRSTITYSLVIPAVSSENYLYIPIGFVNHKTIVTNLAFVIYNSKIWLFAVLTSKMHNLWIRAVCGQHETRNRYSSHIGYNNFPFPEISETEKQKLTECVYAVIAEREKTSEKTLAKMYHKDTITEGLRKSHAVLDEALESCYRKEPFISDQERLEHLFELYKQLEVNND
ncbi:DNA methyltransferase [Staphylococcus equorum]|uniref:DNA methyltransferase n=1 Tax=Staphylococcus equorum TaxID=246432 RepID=UPI003EBAE462